MHHAAGHRPGFGNFDRVTEPRQMRGGGQAARAGTDRQARGRLMAVLRASDEPVRRSALDAVWADGIQRERALDGLVADGLVELVGADRFGLPRRPAGTR